MFGVIGKVDQAIPDWKWRMRTREGFIDLQVADVFALENETLFSLSSVSPLTCVQPTCAVSASNSRTSRKTSGISTVALSEVRESVPPRSVASIEPLTPLKPGILPVRFSAMF